MEYSKFMEKIAKHGYSAEDAKQGGIAFLGSQRDLEAGVAFVEEHEEPIGIVGGEFFYTGPGTMGTNNAVLILTNERIIKADKKIKNTDMEQFYISDINSSKFGTAFLSSSLTISTTSGTITVNRVKKATGSKFNKSLSTLVREYKNHKPQSATIHQATSGMDEIKKAKELLDAGIINQKEFDALKKKHLG